MGEKIGAESSRFGNFGNSPGIPPAPAPVGENREGGGVCGAGKAGILGTCNPGSEGIPTSTGPPRNTKAPGRNREDPATPEGGEVPNSQGREFPAPESAPGRGDAVGSLGFERRREFFCLGSVGFFGKRRRAGFRLAGAFPARGAGAAAPVPAGAAGSAPCSARGRPSPRPGATIPKEFPIPNRSRTNPQGREAAAPGALAEEIPPGFGVFVLVWLGFCVGFFVVVLFFFSLWFFSPGIGKNLREPQPGPAAPGGPRSGTDPPWKNSSPGCGAGGAAPTPPGWREGPGIPPRRTCT